MYFPIEHGAQDPASSLKPYPTPHVLEDKQAVWSAFARVPAEHGVHEVCPVVDVNVDPLQAGHGAVVLVPYFPTSHEKQSSIESCEDADVAESSRYLPAEHALQSVAASCRVADVPGSDKYFPAEQTLHDTAPTDTT